ncbi:hypothetical protein [Teredinibacter turnerae]|uniref:hypothetical protein n=1 Tax=Teredinibacter turnerae TaxID=2426 RepID=UPI00048F845B|nr:hypothetical protein [Teredinibacter turnerae]
MEKEKTVTEIMLNYASALDAIWPYASKIGLVCYDPWEEFNDSLFRHLVVETLAYKYGISIPEVGMESLAYPWKNKSELRVKNDQGIYTFKLFGYPGIDLSGDQDQYFGEGRSLKNISEMKFSHVFCDGSRGEEWLERESVLYEFCRKS